MTAKFMRSRPTFDRGPAWTAAVGALAGAVASCLLVQVAFGQVQKAGVPRQPLNLALRPAVASVDKPVLLSKPRENALAKAISASAHASLIDLGVSTARQALIDCQKGDYPGGGMGLQSLPTQQPEAQSDHCRRF